MNESQAPATPLPQAMVDGSERLSRVRDRTDELELFISGLLAFTLLAVPGRIFDAWATNTVHTEGIHAHALWFGFSIAVGLCYVVAIALIAHLAIRGYWVGLIGLKTHFPQGIRWDRIPLLGGVSRDHYQRMVSTLEQSIAGADRLASVLFSTTLLFALTMVWTGLLTAVLLAIAGVVGALLGAPDQVALTVLGVAYVLFTVTSVLPLVLERAVLRRRARGLPSERLEHAVRVVLRGMGFVLPLRLLLPVQLTLQSNLYARNFYVVYFGAVMLAMVIGGVQTFNSTRFALFNRYTVVTDEAVDHGMASAHYESLRSEHDRLLRYPMIPTDQISESQLRLFIPHQPQRDNSVARRLCADTLRHGRQRGRRRAGRAHRRGLPGAAVDDHPRRRAGRTGCLRADGATRPGNARAGRLSAAAGTPARTPRPAPGMECAEHGQGTGATARVPDSVLVRAGLTARRSRIVRSATSGVVAGLSGPAPWRTHPAAGRWSTTP